LQQGIHGFARSKTSRQNRNLVDVEWFCDEILSAVVDNDPIIVVDALAAASTVAPLQTNKRRQHLRLAMVIDNRFQNCRTGYQITIRLFW